MSVSIAFLPIALAMRIVMGKKGFDTWVRDQQLPVKTVFKKELDLVRTVKSAGFDAVKFGASIKTHINDTGDFFFWELVDGAWIAVFSKHTEKEALSKFMAQIEDIAGHKIFGEITDQMIQAEERYVTNFADRELLIGALREFGVSPKERVDGSIRCKIENTEMLFTQSGDAPFVVKINNAPDLERIYGYLSEIDEDYRRCVQTAVYEKVKARAADTNLLIETEEILEDKSILMTMRVK